MTIALPSFFGAKIPPPAAAAAPVNTVAPAAIDSVDELTDSVASGNQAYSTSGTWTGTPAPTFAYQWQWSANGSTGWTNINGGGATTQLYTVASNMLNRYIACLVTATNASGSVSVRSNTLFVYA